MPLPLLYRASNTYTSAIAKAVNAALGIRKIRPMGAGISTSSGISAFCTKNGYDGPVDLEVIGTKAKAYSLEQCCIIGAETRGHSAGVATSVRGAVRAVVSGQSPPAPKIET